MNPTMLLQTIVTPLHSRPDGGGGFPHKITDDHRPYAVPWHLIIPTLRHDFNSYSRTVLLDNIRQSVDGLSSFRKEMDL